MADLVPSSQRNLFDATDGVRDQSGQAGTAGNVVLLEMVKELREEQAASQQRMVRLFAAFEASGAGMQGVQDKVRAMESKVGAAGDDAVRAKRALAEVTTREDVAKKFRAIQAVRSADPETESELARYRFASGKMEEAALGAKLAASWIREQAASAPGADYALKHLDEAAGAAEAGAKGLLTGALAVERAPAYSHKFVSFAASKVMAKEIKGFDEFGQVSAGLFDVFAERDKELENERRRARQGAPSAGAAPPLPERPGDIKCYRCGKVGHISRHCEQYGTTGVGAAGGKAAGGSA